MLSGYPSLFFDLDKRGTWLFGVQGHNRDMVGKTLQKAGKSKLKMLKH